VRKRAIPVSLIIAFLAGVWAGRRFYESPDTVLEVPIVDRDYYSEVISVIRNAQRSVHLLMFEIFYYPEFPGSKVNDLIDELANAHSRGVDVKVCLEGGEEFLGEDFLEKQLRAYERLREHGVQIRGDSRGITTHAKLLIVDERTVVIGSTNWSYYAVERNAEANVLIESPSLASDFEEYFDGIWKSATPITHDNPTQAPPVSKSASLIAKLLDDPEGWDGRTIKVPGEVIDLEHRRSRGGNLYSTFSVSDEAGNWLKVFKWGHPRIEDGDQVEVEGVFKREKRVGKYTFYNELEAETVTRK
jgi:hypothetical protein